MSNLDVLAPDYVKTSVISVTLADPLATPRAFQAIDLLVELTGAALTSGIMLPVDLLIMAPSCVSRRAPLVRHTYKRVLPGRIAFVPKEGGPHLVLLREQAHNLFWGSLVVDVQGERLEAQG